MARAAATARITSIIRVSPMLTCATRAVILFSWPCATYIPAKRSRLTTSPPCTPTPNAATAKRPTVAARSIKSNCDSSGRAATAGKRDAKDFSDRLRRFGQKHLRYAFGCAPQTRSDSSRFVLLASRLAGDAESGVAGKGRRVDRARCVDHGRELFGHA